MRFYSHQITIDLSYVTKCGRFWEELEIIMKDCSQKAYSLTRYIKKQFRVVRY
jgi:hypothetical protein